MTNQDKNPSVKGRGNDVKDGHSVPDSIDQEREAAKEAMRQSDKNRHLQINEAGRSHDSRAKTNPPGAVHPVPEPSKRETGR